MHGVVAEVPHLQGAEIPQERGPVGFASAGGEVPPRHLFDALVIQGRHIDPAGGEAGLVVLGAAGEEEAALGLLGRSVGSVGSVRSVGSVSFCFAVLLDPLPQKRHLPAVGVVLGHFVEGVEQEEEAAGVEVGVEDRLQLPRLGADEPLKCLPRLPHGQLPPRQRQEHRQPGRAAFLFLMVSQGKALDLLQRHRLPPARCADDHEAAPALQQLPHVVQALALQLLFALRLAQPAQGQPHVELLRQLRRRHALGGEACQRGVEKGVGAEVVGPALEVAPDVPGSLLVGFLECRSALDPVPVVGMRCRDSRAIGGGSDEARLFAPVKDAELVVVAADRADVPAPVQGAGHQAEWVWARLGQQQAAQPDAEGHAVRLPGHAVLPPKLGLLPAEPAEVPAHVGSAILGAGIGSDAGHCLPDRLLVVLVPAQEEEAGRVRVALAEVAADALHCKASADAVFSVRKGHRDRG